MKPMALVVLLVACQTGVEDFPPGPGGGGTGPVVIGGGGGTDAGAGGDGDGGTGGGDGGISVGARVCVVTDLRKPTTCAATGARGLQVSLGAGPKLTISSDDGRFTFTAPASTDLTWHVTGSMGRFVTSAMRYGTDNTIPVMRADTYSLVRAAVGAGLPVDQQGSVVVRVVRGTAPVADVTATTSLGQNNAVFYDGNPVLVDDWVATRTGVLGVVWFPGVALTPSTGTVALTLPGSTTPISVPVTVENDTITFVTKDVP